jgi:hypothetical protein
VEKVRADERLASVLGDRSALHWARHHHSVQSGEVRWRGRDGMTKNDNDHGGDDNYWSRGTGDEVGVGMDDNYRGGDDNYPRVVAKMGAVGRDEGRGRNRQK